MVQGKKVTAATIDKSGVIYVEAAPFARALGGQLSVDAALKKATIVVNSKKAVVPALMSNGKAFVAALATAKALGASVAYDKAAKLLTITTITQTPMVKGITQLAGDNARFGQTFTLNEATPVNVTLRGAEYAVTGLRFGDTTVFPKLEEKLLVVHYTLQNPNANELTINWATLRFTAVDAENMNYEYVEYVGEEQTKEKIGMALKPGQKIDVYTAIVVPASKAIPKLMVLPPTGKVLRYDLNLDENTVKGLPAPYGDPKDPTGAVAVSDIPAEMGKPGIYGRYRITLKSAEYSIAGQVFGNDVIFPKQDEKLLVLHYTIQNADSTKADLNWSTIRATAIDAGNANYGYVEYIGVESDHEKVGADLAPGQSLDVYSGIIVPAAKPMRQIKLQADGWRALVYDLATPANAVKGLKAPYADPSDAAGAVALTEIPATLNTPYITGTLQVTLTNAVYSTVPFGDEEVPEDGAFLLVTYMVKNLDVKEADVNWGVFAPALMLDDDTEGAWSQDIYTAKAARSFSGQLKVGQEVTIRHRFAIPAETKAKMLTIREGSANSGRSLVFDLSKLPAPR